MTEFVYAESTATVDEIASRLKSAKRLLCLTHQKPDGDALGSVLSITRAARRNGAHAEFWLAGPFSPSLKSLIGSDEPWTHVKDESAVPKDDSFDLIVLCDTGATSQVWPFADWLKARRARTIILDHHINGDDLASMRLVRTDCASTTQLIAEVIEAWDVFIDGSEFSIGEALFAGLATDTGWFRFKSADAAAFARAASLLATGVDKSRLYRTLEETYRPARLRVMQRVLASLELIADDRAAIMSLSPEDFRELKVTPDELTGLVNLPMEVTTVECTMLLSSEKAGETKVSLRSKPAPRSGEDFVDVNKFAHTLGGGGHANAAGLRLKKSLPEAKKELITALEKFLKDVGVMPRP